MLRRSKARPWRITRPPAPSPKASGSTVTRQRYPGCKPDLVRNSVESAMQFSQLEHPLDELVLCDRKDCERHGNTFPSKQGP
jgi:hypothetical protein